MTEYFSALSVVAYSLGLRSIFYALLMRLTDARTEWFPPKEISCCWTEARNILGVFSVAIEILDAVLACFCGAKFYIVRKSLGDGLTVSRYMHNKKVRTYVFFLLVGLFVWTAVECGEFAAGAGAHLLHHWITEIKLRKKIRMRI